MSQTFKSFTELANAMGIKPTEKKAKTEKTIKCKVCGSDMHRVSGTNLIVCSGTTKDKEGNEKPCKNFILANKVN